MSKLRSVCVYCGSGTGLDPGFEESATIVGRALAEAGMRLIYGGGSVGLMGAVARAALDAGGEVTGIIPRFLQQRERLFDDVTEIILTDDMHERKMCMFERSEAFVALPGGIGTLEELIEQMTWAQLGRHDKPVLIANINGFWDPLIALIDQMRAESFIRPGMEVTCLIAEEAEEVVPMLQRAAAQRPRRELERTAAAEPLSRM